MEILKSIFDFDELINFIAFVIILSLMILATVGTYRCVTNKPKKVGFFLMKNKNEKNFNHRKI